MLWSQPEGVSGCVRNGSFWQKKAQLFEYETGKQNGKNCGKVQATHEIYLKPFEMAVKEGRSNGVMNSKNGIGSFCCKSI